MRIVDLHHYRGPFTYCGRGMPRSKVMAARVASPLRNPFKVQEHGAETLPKFRRHLHEAIERQDAAIMAAMRALSGDSVLGCWCVDLEYEAVYLAEEVCHCQIIFKAWHYLRMKGALAT